MGYKNEILIQEELILKREAWWRCDVGTKSMNNGDSIGIRSVEGKLINIAKAHGGVSIFGKVGERTCEENDLYMEMK